MFKDSCRGDFDATPTWSVIQSPSYSDNNLYAPCRWLLRSTDKVVVLEILSINLEANSDYLTIYDGADSFAPIIATLTGGATASETYKSTTDHMFITLTSNIVFRFR